MTSFPAISAVSKLSFQGKRALWLIYAFLPRNTTSLARRRVVPAKVLPAGAGMLGNGAAKGESHHVLPTDHNRDSCGDSPGSRRRSPSPSGQRIWRSDHGWPQPWSSQGAKADDVGEGRRYDGKNMR